jgi:SSS family solute:Na+ symporter/sodium/proline symporter
LLAPATSVVRDIYQRFLRPNASDRSIVLVSRTCVLLLGAVALGLAYTSEKFFDVALFAYTIYGCAITPAMLAAFFWKRATAAGGASSIAVGAAVAIAVKVFGIGDFEPVLLALPFSVGTLVVVSLLGSPPSVEQANAI